MRIKTLLLISSLFFSYSFFAQEVSKDYDITWSQPNKYKNDLTFLGAKKTDDGYLVFDKETIKGPGGWRYYIEFFNNDMQFEKKVDISEEVDEENYTIVDVINYGDNFLLITSRFFKKENKEEFYIQSIGEPKQVIGKRIKFHEEQTYKKKLRSRFELSVSPNDKFLLLQVVSGFRKKFEKTLSLILMDENLNVQWSKEEVVFDVGLNTESQLLTTYNIIINDSGEIYFLVSDDIKTNRRDNSISYFHILKMINGVFTGASITLENEALRGMDIKLSKNNKLHCIGFYTENPKGESREGVASLTIDSDLNSILSENYTLYDKNFLRRDLEGRDLKKAEKEIEENEVLFKDLKNEEIIQHKDGSLTFIGEIQYSYTYTTGSGENQSTKTNFVYGGLFLSRINANGEIISNTLFQKSNTFSRPMEKHNLMYPANHKFVRIDHVYRPHFKNYDESKSKKDKILIVAVIDENGEQVEEALFDPADKVGHEKDRMGNVATNGAVLSNNEIILLFSHKKKEYKFVRITSLLDN